MKLQYSLKNIYSVRWTDKLCRIRTGSRSSESLPGLPRGVSFSGWPGLTPPLHPPRQLPQQPRTSSHDRLPEEQRLGPIRNRLPKMLANPQKPTQRPGERGTKTHHSRKLQVRYPPLNALHILHIKLHKRIRQDHLNLIRRKEPPGTRVPPQPERKVPLVHANELVRRPRRGGLLARAIGGRVDAGAVEAEGVEGRGVGVDGRVLVYAYGGGLDYGARGDDLAAGEGEGLEDLAAE